MEEQTEKPKEISYYDHEAQIARSETHSRRWAVAALIVFIALVISNATWAIYELKTKDVVTETYTAETDQGGHAYNIIAKDKATLNYGDQGETKKDNSQH